MAGAGGGKATAPLRHRLVRLFELLLVAVAVSAVVIAVGARLHRSRLLEVGAEAPAFALPGDDGRSHSLPRQPVLLEFFETTCPHCQEAASTLCGTASTRPGLVVLAIDSALEDAAALARFRQRYLAGCPASDHVVLLLDPGDRVTQVYRVTAVPTVYVVDGRGRIAFAGTGTGAVTQAASVVDRLASGG